MKRPALVRSRAQVTVRASVICTYHAAQSHAKAGHPESPARVEAILDRLRTHVWPGTHLHPRGSSSSNQVPVQLVESSRAASQEELALVHPLSYITAVQTACGRLKEPQLVDESTYLAPQSYGECARSVGAALDLLDQLLSTPPSSAPEEAATAPSPSGPPTRDPHRPHAAGFALVRPPGHHVLPARPMGFGVFNTVSIAARYARERHGIDRILIVDFDVHHGNGTMEVFYNDCRTLYVSTHQAGLWPLTGKARETGSGEGRGATINVPLPGGSGDQAMRQVWSRVVLPAADRFRPQLVLVSAGYDAHWRDPLAGLQLQPGTYHWMCTELLSLSGRWCPGRLALLLEGGYQRDSLADCVVASLEGLMGLPVCSVPPPGPRELYEEPLQRMERVVQEVCALHGL